MKNLVIDRRIVRSNLLATRERADGARLIADLSANAGGMGLADIAVLLRDEGVRDFAVSDPRDAAILRRRGFTEERIMMLRSTADPKELEELIDLNVVCTAGSYDAAVAINGIAEAKRTVADIQVKVDTGLGRYGFLPAEVDRIAAIYKYMSSLNVIGTFTTFSASWRGKAQTLAQLDTFNAVLDKLTGMGLEPGIAHCCDSAAIFRYDFAHMDAVRVDTALSGRVPGKAIPGLAKVGCIEAGIEEICWVPKGHRYGAERAVTTKVPTKIAVLSVGYYHGFAVDRHIAALSVRETLLYRRRQLYVKINGQRARVLGNVGLLHTLVDVTKIDCTVGDVAILDVDPVNVKGLPMMYL
ncbi:MAG: alanine racemase [Oscillospiraceae bacterium]|nr:alanine racemase [Oscillospiraceae bacterium]